MQIYNNETKKPTSIIQDKLARKLPGSHLVQFTDYHDFSSFSGLYLEECRANILQYVKPNSVSPFQPLSLAIFVIPDVLNVASAANTADGFLPGGLNFTAQSVANTSDPLTAVKCNITSLGT
jgi:hypothetical protein